MTGLEDRQALARGIQEARKNGARLRQACAVVGISVRTLQRWQTPDGKIRQDGRPGAVRPVPAHALSEEERARLLAVANEPRFADVPPARIVPMLADEGVYLASESTFSRVLREQGQSAHRGRAKSPQAVRPPTTHVATGPRQVWCWDMTYLPAQVAGQWFFLYLILDLYSRKIVGWEVHADDHSDHATRLVLKDGPGRRHCCSGCKACPARRQWLDLEGDDGAGHAPLARHQTVVFPPACLGRQRLRRVLVPQCQVSAGVSREGLCRS
jgi:putative transposase